MITEKEVIDYITSKLKPLNVKFKFVSKVPQQLYGMATQLSTRTIFISPRDIAYVANYFNIIYKVNWKDFVDWIISHELKHLEVINELPKIKIPIHDINKIEYVILQEFYISKILPDPYYIKESARDKILGKLIFEEGRAELSRKIFYSYIDAMLLTVYLSEDEIKGFFEGKPREFLLLLKDLYNKTNSIYDIKTNAETLRRALGW